MAFPNFWPPLYLPASEVDRGEKERKIPSVETLPSQDVVTVEPFTVQVALESTRNGRFGLQLCVRLSVQL